MRRRGGRRRALGTRAPLTLPQEPNQRWSLDFVSDMLADGRRFRVLVVVDDFTRECLALVVDTSLSGIRVARELDRLVKLRESSQSVWTGLKVQDTVPRRGIRSLLLPVVAISVTPGGRPLN